MDNCVKTYGQKREERAAERQDVPRELSLYDPSIQPSQVMSLQSVWSGHAQDTVPLPFRAELTHFLFRILALKFGRCIIHVPLRHAMMAVFDRDRTARYRYKDLALSELHERMGNPAVLNEGDLFTTFVLAFCERTDNSELRDLIKRFIVVMRQLLSYAEGSVKGFELSVFWPFAQDCFRWMHKTILLDGPGSLLPNCRQIVGFLSFRQWLAYVQAFNSLTAKHGTSASLFALRDVQSDEFVKGGPYSTMFFHNTHLLRLLERRLAFLRGLGVEYVDPYYDRYLREIQLDLNAMTMQSWTVAWINDIKTHLMNYTSDDRMPLHAQTEKFGDYCWPRLEAPLYISLNRMLCKILRARTLSDGLRDSISLGCDVAYCTHMLWGFRSLSQSDLQWLLVGCPRNQVKEEWKRLVREGGTKYLDGIAALFGPYE
jgi:hypothetical protein